MNCEKQQFVTELTFWPDVIGGEDTELFVGSPSMYFRIFRIVFFPPSVTLMFFL